MEQIEFKKLLSKILLQLDFKKSSNVFFIGNEEIMAFIDLQKSNYDNCSYYLNFGFCIKDFLKMESFHKPPFYDLSGRFLFESNGKNSGLFDINLIKQDKFIEDVERQIKDKIFFGLEKGLKGYLNRFPEYLPAVTLNAKKYLGLDK